MSSSKVTRHRLVTKDHLPRKELFEDHNGGTNPHSRQNAWKWSSFMEKKTKKERVFAWLMLFLVIGESSFLFIQAAKGFSSKSTEDVDLVAFIVLLVSNIMWLLYGTFVLRDLPVMLSGVLYTIGAILVIITIALYGNNQGSKVSPSPA